MTFGAACGGHDEQSIDHLGLSYRYSADEHFDYQRRQDFAGLRGMKTRRIAPAGSLSAVDYNRFS